MENTSENPNYTINHNKLADLYPSFGETIHPLTKTLGQFNLVADKFLKEYQTEGNVTPGINFLGDNDEVERISSLTFENKMDYQVFMEYLTSHVAVSLTPENPEGFRGLEDKVLGVQRKFGASGPYSLERRADGTLSVPPVLFQVPDGMDNKLYRDIVESEFKNQVPGVDIALSYVQEDKTRYC